MSKFLEIMCRVPLPDDLMESHPIQTEVLSIGKEFRDKVHAFAKTKKIDGVKIESRMGAEKTVRNPRKKKTDAAAAVAAPPPPAA